MSNPLPRNLEPLAKKHIEDTGKKILSNGKVTNGKKGLLRHVWKSIYEYGLTLYNAGMIYRKSGRYFFAEYWNGMPYPFKSGSDLTNGERS